MTYHFAPLWFTHKDEQADAVYMLETTKKRDSTVQFSYKLSEQFSYQK